MTLKHRRRLKEGTMKRRRTIALLLGDVTTAPVLSLCYLHSCEGFLRVITATVNSEAEVVDRYRKKKKKHTQSRPEIRRRQRCISHSHIRKGLRVSVYVIDLRHRRSSSEKRSRHVSAPHIAASSYRLGLVGKVELPPLPAFHWTLTNLR